MSQTRLTTYYNSRKRPAADDIVTTKRKIIHLDSVPDSDIKSNAAGTEQGSQSSLEYASKLIKGCEAFTSKVNASNVSTIKKPSKTELVSTARKELSLGDIRKKLAGSSRLAELKASADRLSKGIQQLKAEKSSDNQRNLKEFKTIDVEVPSSPSKKTLIQNEFQSPVKGAAPSTLQRPFISPRKVVVSPVKSPNKVPAYIRHASLATSSSTLPLPHHYRFLAELFRGLETVVSLLHNRNEKITFAKLKPSVQDMLKRNFTEKHLAQIKHLVPDFYNFELQKIKTFSTSCQKEAYELVISPNFPSELKLMNPSVLLERRRFFYDTLLQAVKKHHAQYLMSLDPPMVIPDSKLTRWHPEFEIEKLPDIECAKLPEVPNAEKFSTAQDVLAKARELFKCNTKMERALEKLAQAKARGLTDQEKVVTGIKDEQPKIVANASTQASTPTTSGVTLLNPALRNLPASLLEKVKAKQAAKALEAMTRSSDQDQKYLIYSRLPDLARTLRNIFVTERKNVLPLTMVLSKLDSSFKSNVSSKDLERDIKALTEETPEWVKLHEIRNTTYLKLDKNSDLKQIVSKLEALADKYKCD
ncbi:hypothetical protein MSG28_005102 [Choristoneura fumiferana]|uniref:Uncharacterized protein n=1 Tax=Choristoneura fumiferana TaxID=7141 RepID=A0ACC0JQH9_CHOFU|nr:hypothetical protein MSG28_005102 [Choristoneura fumiferana]